MAQPSFPLPKGYFGDVQLSAGDLAFYRELVGSELQSALKDEHDFVHRRKRQVDASTWKHVARKHQMEVYSHRDRSKVVHGSRMPYLLAVGKTEGTIEDLLFEVYCKTHEEMKIAGLLVDVGCKDSTVLNTYETATEEDPYHCATLKWQLTKFPVGRKRDWCYIENLGINTDERGERYGYLVLQSVERPECPPFQHKVAVRGRLSLTFIYRQLSPGSVGIYSRGVYDPAGELIQQLSLIATASVLTGMTSVLCAEAKKLTLLAMANRRARPARTETTCSVCSKGSSLRVSMRVCQICHQTACSKCVIKKHLFVPSKYDWMRAGCCANCIVRAKNMNVRPAEPEYSIAAILSSSSVRDSSVQTFSLSSSRRSPSSSTCTEPAGLNRTGIGRSIDSSQSSLSVDSSMTDEEMAALFAQVMNRGAKLSLQSHRRSLEARDDDELIEAPKEIPQRAPPPVSSRNNGTVDQQQALYLRLLKLQAAAEQVYDTTQANQDLMHRM